MDHQTNKIYYGDCRDLLKTFPQDSIDLIYIDPPFFTNKKRESLNGEGPHLREYSDKWDGEIEYYLDWMKERLLECHRILKNTGSIYLHCDSHAGHYLKVVMDEIFGRNNFRNEIIWHYRTGGVSKRWFANKHDTIFFYSKSSKWIFNTIEVKEYYADIYGPNFKPGWEDRRPGKDEKGDFRYAYMDDVWNIPGVFNMSAEYLAYPTQKPEALLERIITASSKEGEIVLDPMCGTGTTLARAHKLNRKWIGMDVSLTACKIVAKRLRKIGVNISDKDIIGFPLRLEEIKSMEPTDFENLIRERLNATITPKLQKDLGIDGLWMGYPIEIKQLENVSIEVIADFVKKLEEMKKERGIIAALSFTKESYDEVNKLKKEGKLEIYLSSSKELAEKMFTKDKSAVIITELEGMEGRDNYFVQEG